MTGGRVRVTEAEARDRYAEAVDRFLDDCRAAALARLAARRGAS